MSVSTRSSGCGLAVQLADSRSVLRQFLQRSTWTSTVASSGHEGRQRLLTRRALPTAAAAVATVTIAASAGAALAGRKGRGVVRWVGSRRRGARRAVAQRLTRVAHADPPPEAEALDMDCWKDFGNPGSHPWLSVRHSAAVLEAALQAPMRCRGLDAVFADCPVAIGGAAPAGCPEQCPLQLKKGGYVPLALQGEALDERAPLELSEEDLLELREKHIVQKQEVRGHSGRGLVVAEVQAPPAAVLACLADFEAYPRRIPVVREVTVRERSNDDVDGTEVVRCNYRLSRFWIGVTVQHIVDRSRGVVRFDLIPAAFGKWLHEASGYWYVEPSPDSTPDSPCSRVHLRAGLKACPLLPQWLLDYAAERALRRATSWMKPTIEALWEEEKREMKPLARLQARGSELLQETSD
eukprot:TRINITY_DN14201_c0_g1_i1.p1 TRINITY_DN14201_c0_g1~~TRINITY_DN14201_c0_g1_i1.p1  ORF type:complete len:431 (+),score=94.72 TRINITY_DN14201_c0_g1_i1:69-1295(+)